MSTAQGFYVSGRLRDEFLMALDGDDTALSQRLAEQLIDCGNVLPGMACDQLGLPRQSTYSRAARAVIDAPGRSLRRHAPCHATQTSRLWTSSSA